MSGHPTPWLSFLARQAMSKHTLTAGVETVLDNLEKLKAGALHARRILICLDVDSRGCLPYAGALVGTTNLPQDLLRTRAPQCVSAPPGATSP